jgi:hypothetical protein
MSTRDRFSVVLRLLAGPARSGQIVGHAEVVDTGEQVPIRGAEDLEGLARRLGNGEGRTHTSRRRLRAVIVMLLVVGACFAGQVASGGPAGAAACTKAWINTNGSFNEPLNWSPSGVPTGTDVACITASGTYTVTLEQSGAGVAELVLGGASGTQELKLVSAPFHETHVGGAMTIGTHGVVTMTSTGGEASVSINSSAALINNSGLIHTVAGTGGNRIIGGQFTNQSGGIIDIDTTTQFVYGGSHLINSGGTIDMTAPLSVFAGARITNTSGVINGTGTGQLLVTDSNEGFTQVNGTVTGNPVRVHGGAPLNVTGTGASKFWLSGGAKVSGRTVPGQTVTLIGIPNGGDTIGFVDGFVNDGVLNVTSLSALDVVFAPTEQGKAWTNTGTVRVTAGAGGLRALQGVLHNRAGGLLDVDTATQYVGMSHLLNDGGTVDMTAPLSVFAGARVTNTSGVINGTGTGQLLVTDSNEGFRQVNGTVTGNPVRVHGGAPLDVTGTGASKFWLSGGAKVSGKTVPGQTLTLIGIPNGGDTIGFVDGFVNDGVLNVTSLSGLDVSLSPVEQGKSWTNTGTVRVLPGAGGLRILRGVLNNKAGGLLDIDTPTQYVNPTSLLRNRGGTIELSSTLSVFDGAVYSQTSAGTLRTNIASNANFGRLLSDTPAVLAGTIAANTTFDPAVGKTFTVVTFASRTGSYTDKSFTGGTTYTVRHNAKNVQLIAR